MDQTTDAVEQDLKGIIATRTAIADKLQRLEQGIEASLHSSRQAIHQLVHEGTITMERAATIGNGARWIAKHAEKQPWMLFGTAVALGFFAGRLTSHVKRQVYPYYTPGAKGAGVMPEKGKEGEDQTEGIYPYYPNNSAEVDPSAASGLHPTRPTVQTPFLVTLIEGLREEAATEVGHLQRVILQAGRKLVRDVLRELVPASHTASADQGEKPDR